MSERIVVVYAHGWCYASVCAHRELTPEEIVTEANRWNHPGIGKGWQLANGSFKDGSANPHTCEDEADRLHYLLVC